MRTEQVKYLLSKLLQLVISLVILLLLVFFLARLAPGDPLYAYYGDGLDKMSIEQKQAAEIKLGLDKGLITQLVIWVQGAAQGDFGLSYQYKQSVMDIIGSVYANTLILGITAFVLTFLLAFGLGCFCALHEDKLADKLICKIGVITNSIPSFWLALIFILFFCVNLRLLPSGGAYDIGRAGDMLSRLKHLILPLSVMILSHLWYYAYMVRNKLLEEIRRDYVLLAKAKGLSKRQIIYCHLLPNIMPAMLYVMAIAIPHIVGGTFIVEQVFSYPGLGKLLFEAASYHDYNMLMVLSLLTGAAIIFFSILAQMLSDIIDPRMKHLSREEACNETL